MGRGEVLQHQRLSFFAARAVEVDPRLERAAFAEGVRLGARAGEVLAVDAAADVDLGRLGAVAAADGFAAAVVVVRRRPERVDPRRAFIRVPGPATRLPGDVGIAEADRPWSTCSRPVRARRRRQRAEAEQRGARREQRGEQRQVRRPAFSDRAVHVSPSCCAPPLCGTVRATLTRVPEGGQRRLRPRRRRAPAHARRPARGPRRRRARGPRPRAARGGRRRASPG